jgi:cytoskeleton protein RodZ
MADSDAESAPETPPPPPQTLGQILRSTRHAHDLTLEQLSTELRIEAKQLNALEEERFEQIGVPVFIKGYLKQYCLRLGLDFNDMLALYYKQTSLPDVQIQPSRTIKLHDERQITSWVVSGVILLALIAALAVWWSNGGSFQAPAVRNAPEPAETTDAAPPAAAPVEAPPAAPLPASAVVAPPPVAAGAAPADAGAAVAVSAAAPFEVPSAAPGADDERAAPAVAIPLQFTFDQESWAEVTDGRGERLLFGLNAAGRRVTVRGEPPFAVVLGNAAAVQLTVDGEPYSIPTTGREGALARFSVDIAEE